MKSLNIYILILFMSQIYCDLPINCYNSQIAGKWRFHLTKPRLLENPFVNNCGHKVPDAEKTSFLAELPKGVKYMEDFSVQMELREDGTLDYSALEPEFPAPSPQSPPASWTMIYNEGFEVRVDSLRMLLFNKYFKDDSNPNNYLSNCAKTLVGWYRHGDSEQYGCIQGEKEDGKDLINDNNTEGSIVLQGKCISKKQQSMTVSEQRESIGKEPLKFRFKTLKDGKSEKKNKVVEKIRMNAQFKNHQRVVARLNMIQGKTWVAAVNRVFQNKTVKEVNGMSGRAKKTVLKKKDGDLFQQEYAALSKQVDQMLQDTPEQAQHFDWSEEIGYMPQVIEQVNCGSCYIISTMNMIDFRLKIADFRKRNKPNKDRLRKKSSKQQKIEQKLQMRLSALAMKNSVEVPSVQHAMDCNYYNQGCDGGYSMLVSKFGQEQFFIEQKHKTYQQEDRPCGYQHLTQMDDFSRVIKIREYGYTGGRYGSSNHLNILREMRDNGPVVLSFSPDDTFQYYHSGVYQSISKSNWVDQNIQRPEWTNVDHSVLAYGWGEESGVKYWLCQNSWGNDFGISGSFRIRRGDDHMGIESSAEFASPYVLNLTPSQVITYKNKLEIEHCSR